MNSKSFNLPIHKMHCIIHQKYLCYKPANLTDVMSVVVKVVNSILPAALTTASSRHERMISTHTMMTCFTSVRSAG